MMQKVRARVAGRDFEFDLRRVERIARALDPEPIRDHFVVVHGVRFPPKQLLQALTGLDRNDFTTNQARSVLRRLGLPVGRADEGAHGRPTRVGESAPSGTSSEAENLRPHRGRWVATRGRNVLVADDSPESVYAWLLRHDVRADSMFKVPLDPEADIGGFAS